MGAGIDARYARCGAYWAKHIELCKTFQRLALSAAPRLSTVAVLGAGRLYDVDAALLLSKFDHVRLYDADPAAASSWRKGPLSGAEAHCVDLTGCFDEWRSAFRPAGRSPEALAESMARLSSPDPSGTIETADCVLSLNLLSQIPLYWRDHVEDLASRLGIARDARGAYPEPLEGALLDSMRRLQAQHLTLLGASAARYVLLVSDTEFMYYRKDSPHWQVEKALLEPLTILEESFDSERADSWLWHIAPQDVEQPGYGQIHRVGAWSFSRKAGR